MEPVFTFNEIRNIENQIIGKDNFPSVVLMENAGKNSFDILQREIKDLAEYNIFIICGKGNNAGDGYTLARHLAINNYEFRVIQAEEQFNLKGDARINYDLLVSCLGSKKAFLTLENFAGIIVNFQKKTKILIIDALLGTGISGNLTEKYKSVISLLNSLRARFKKLVTISLDIPSGLSGGITLGPVIKADMTISMGTMKAELLFGAGKENSGNVYIAPIGVTAELVKKYDSYQKYFIELNDVKKIFPERKKASYKYSNGKVLVIGGSKNLSGAVIMSSISAIKSGAGGVAAAIPESISSFIGKKYFEIMKTPLAETAEGTIAGDSFDKIKQRMEWADTILIGPGISLNEETKKFVFDVVLRSTKDLVIDADALTLLASDTVILKKRNPDIRVILTPHIGEFSKLSKISTDEILANRFEAVRHFASEFNVNVMLKSETSLSCTADGEIYLNSTGNQSLASAGTGDVLSGIVASVFAGSHDPKTAMICGNFIHGLCADLYFEKYKNKQTASPTDFIKLIPESISEILK